MLRILSLIPLLAICSLIPSALKAEDLKEVGRSLSVAYDGKVLVLRKSCRGGHLKYNSDGEAQNCKNTSQWTLYGTVKINKVHLRQDNLKIEATRIFLTYDKEMKRFAELRGGEVSLLIDLDSATAGLDSITILLRRIFVKPEESLADIEPPYWSHFLRAYKSGKPDETELAGLDGGPIYKVEPGKVSAPKEISAPSPNYTQEAEDAHYQGNSVLSLVVNREGRPEDISIMLPVGMGLDDNAVETVRDWRFKPGIRDGLPVPVRVLIEVTFKSPR